MKTILLIILITTIGIKAQNVGINNTNPTQTLDVNGDTYADKIFIKNMRPPEVSGGIYISGNKSTPPTLGVYGQTNSLFTYLPIEFTNVPQDGIIKYDTKISDTEYILVLHNYQLKTSDGQTSVALDFDGAINRQGSPEFTTEKVNGTWHIKGRFTGSKMVNSSRSSDTRFGITLYLIAYKYIITKQNITPITTDLSIENSTIAAPIGF